MAAKTAQPWRTEPVIRPSVFVSPAPIAKIRTICEEVGARRRVLVGVRGVGVEEAAAVRPELLDRLLRGDRPLRRSSARRPRRVFTATSAWKFWTTPARHEEERARRSEMGSRTQRIARVQSNQKLPMPVAFSRATPRITATAIAIPVAADRKLWRARPAICVKCDIVDSPE